MDTYTIDNQLAQFRAPLEERIIVDELIVFGSYARGAATADSDIDVIVVSDVFAMMSEDERLRLLDRVAASSNRAFLRDFRGTARRLS